MTYSPATPAPGAFGTITLPANTHVSILLITASLSTDAAVANRRMILYPSMGLLNYEFPASYTQVASQLAYYTWGPGLPHANFGPPLTAGSIFCQAPLADMIPANGTIDIIFRCAGIQPGDQIANLKVVVHEWIGT